MFRHVSSFVKDLPPIAEPVAPAIAQKALCVLLKIAWLGVYLCICALLAVCIVGMGSVLLAWYTNHPACNCYTQQLNLSRLAWESNRHLIEAVAGVFFLAELILLKRLFFTREALISLVVALVIGTAGYLGHQYFYETNSYTRYYLLIMSPLIVSYDYRGIAEQLLDPMLTKKFFAGSVFFILSFGICWVWMKGYLCKVPGLGHNRVIGMLSNLEHK